MQKTKRSTMTIILIAVNILVFVVFSIMGDTEDTQFMLAHGAMYPEYVSDGQIWRMFTAMFLHFGLIHLLNNMVMLGAAGAILEKAVGPFKLLILYLVSGICGNVLSYEMMMFNEDYAAAAGASGAILGLVGALVWVVIINNGKYEGISKRQMLLMVILVIYAGVTTSGVDNWAHLGGLVGGFVLAIVLCHKKSYNNPV